MALDDPFDAYRQELGMRDLDPKTRRRYWQVAQGYQRWLNDREVTPETAKLFLAHLRELGYRPASIELYYVGLRLLLDFLGMKLKVKLRKAQTLPPLHDPGDMERLLEAARRGLPGQGEAVQRRNHNAIAILMDTGLRISELMQMRVGDVGFNRCVLVVRHGKGQKQRAIPLTARASLAIRSQIQGRRAQQRVIEAGNTRNMYRAIVNLARSIGLEGVHPHSLRHFFGTQLAERGVRLEVIQDLMGHADPATTRVYVAVTGRSLREAVSALEGPTGPALLAAVPKAPNPRGDGLSEMGLSWELPRS
jgi:integrase/recombinase XerD